MIWRWLGEGLRGGSVVADTKGEEWWCRAYSLSFVIDCFSFEF